MRKPAKNIIKIGLNKEGKDLLAQAKTLADQAIAIYKEIKKNPEKYSEVKKETSLNGQDSDQNNNGIIYDKTFCHEVGNHKIMWTRVTVQNPPYEVPEIVLTSFRDNSKLDFQAIAMVLEDDFKKLDILKEK